MWCLAGFLALQLAACQHITTFKTSYYIESTTTDTIYDIAIIPVVTAWNLTKTFTPPSGCLDLSYTQATSTNGAAFGEAYINITSIAGRPSSCYPPGFGISETYVRNGNNYYDGSSTNYLSYYYPGVCPNGYTSASDSKDLSLSYTACCPSLRGVIYASANGGPSSGVCYVALQLDPFQGDPPITSAITIANATTSTIAPTASGGPSVVLADSIVLVANDLYSTTTRPAGTSTPSPSTASSTGITEPDTGLSKGAEAGIGVGVAIAAMLIALAMFVVWRLKTYMPKAAKADFGKAELPDTSKPTPQLEGEEIHEIGGDERSPELDDKNVRAELDGSWPGWEVSAEQRKVSNGRE